MKKGRSKFEDEIVKIRESVNHMERALNEKEENITRLTGQVQMLDRQNDELKFRLGEERVRGEVAQLELQSALTMGNQCIEENGHLRRSLKNSGNMHEVVSSPSEPFSEKRMTSNFGGNYYFGNHQNKVEQTIESQIIDRTFKSADRIH